MKTLYDISWQVDEPTYRKDPALSQSTLAKYEREGFANLSTLFDHVSTPSLTFGSMVDEMITGDMESFHKRFIVAEFPKLEPAQETAVQEMCSKYGKMYKSMDDIPDTDIISTLNDCSFYQRWGSEKRIIKIKEQACKDYYRLLRASDEKQVVAQSDYDDALRCAQQLRSAPGTAVYFGKDSDDVKRYYQLKFKSTIRGVEYRVMLDLCIVDYKRKVVIPCDLKTTSSMEYEFGDSFMKWRYDIQARLYWRVLRDNMDNDSFFKDFELKDFRFICINRNNNTPLVWEFPNTNYDKDINLGYKKLRAPWTIGAELKSYLDNRPAVPTGIKAVGLNSLGSYLQKKFGLSSDEADQAW